MGWAFWRREAPEAPEVAEPAARAREGEVDNPAAELRARTRRRLIGAAALLLVSVIVVPMLLDSTPRAVPDEVAISIPVTPLPVKQAEPAPVAETKAIDGAAAKPEVVPPDAPQRQPRSAAEPAPSATVSMASAEKYALQVAALSTQGAANQLAARLKKAGFVAYVELVQTTEGPRHRVRVGPFPAREDAQRAIEKLRKAGFAGVLVSA